MDPPDSADKYMCLNGLLLKQLECPVCLETCEPPIKMCVRTHIVCSKCGESLTECATCRQPMSTERCWFAEQMYNHLQMPCQNSEEGCNSVMNVLCMDTHKDRCQFNSHHCLIPENNTIVDGKWNHCTWTGQLADLPTHLDSAHSGSTCENNTTRVLVLSLLENTDSNSSIIHDIQLVSAFGCYFWFMVVCHQATKELEFITFFVGPNESSEMSYKIVTGTKDTTMMIVRKSYIPISLEDSKEKSSKLKYRILKPSVHTDGTLSYKMCISHGKLSEGFQILSNLRTKSDSTYDIMRRLSYLRV